MTVAIGSAEGGPVECFVEGRAVAAEAVAVPEGAFALGCLAQPPTGPSASCTVPVLTGYGPASLTLSATPGPGTWFVHAAPPATDPMGSGALTADAPTGYSLLRISAGGKVVHEGLADLSQPGLAGGWVLLSGVPVAVGEGEKVEVEYRLAEPGSGAGPAFGALWGGPLMLHRKPVGFIAPRVARELAAAGPEALAGARGAIEARLGAGGYTTAEALTADLQARADLVAFEVLGRKGYVTASEVAKQPVLGYYAGAKAAGWKLRGSFDASGGLVTLEGGKLTAGYHPSAVLGSAPGGTTREELEGLLAAKVTPGARLAVALREQPLLDGWLRVHTANEPAEVREALSGLMAAVREGRVSAEAAAPGPDDSPAMSLLKARALGLTGDSEGAKKLLGDLAKSGGPEASLAQALVTAFDPEGGDAVERSQQAVLVAVRAQAKDAWGPTLAAAEAAKPVPEGSTGDLPSGCCESAGAPPSRRAWLGAAAEAPSEDWTAAVTVALKAKPDDGSDTSTMVQSWRALTGWMNGEAAAAPSAEGALTAPVVEVAVPWRDRRRLAVLSMQAAAGSKQAEGMLSELSLMAPPCPEVPEAMVRRRDSALLLVRGLAEGLPAMSAETRLAAMRLAAGMAAASDPPTPWHSPMPHAWREEMLRELKKLSPEAAPAAPDAEASVAALAEALRCVALAERQAGCPEPPPQAAQLRSAVLHDVLLRLVAAVPNPDAAAEVRACQEFLLGPGALYFSSAELLDATAWAEQQFGETAWDPKWAPGIAWHKWRADFIRARKGNPDTVRRHLEHIVSAAPGTDDAWQALRSLVQAFETEWALPDEAVRVHRRIIEMFPNSERAYDGQLQLSKLLYQQKKYEDALIELTLLSESLPEGYRAQPVHLLLGLTHLGLGAGEEARQELIKVINADDGADREKALYLLGYSYIIERRYSDATKPFTDLISLYPDGDYAVRAQDFLAKTKPEAK